MADRVHKLLLGYLIGALEDSERRRIERRLQSDPRWRSELVAVRESLQTLRLARQTYEPPADLAARTCQYLAMFAPPAAHPAARSPAHERRALRRARRMTAAVAPPSSRPSWSWADLGVAAAILVLLSLLIFPAVRRNRDHARLMACQSNLRQIGLNLVARQESHPELASPAPDRAAPADDESSTPLMLAAFVPPVVPPAQEVGGLEVSPEASLGWLNAPRPGHHGISDSARGQNVLFGDGRVTFVSTGWERPSEEGWLLDQNSAIPAPTLTVLGP
jgi:anti-sigma-K factor RskA